MENFLLGLVAALAGLLAICFLAIMTGILLLRHHVIKIVTMLPRMQWLTLEEVVARGLSEFWARLILPSFHDQGYLEVRAAPEFIEFLKESLRREEVAATSPYLTEIREIVESLEKGAKHMDFDFDFETVELHEFRLVGGGKRRKPKSFGLSLPDLWARPQPA